MDVNLRRCIKKYKNGHKIESKSDLIRALDSIIDEEMARPDGEIDIDLVDKAVETSLRLQGIEAANYADTKEMLFDTGIGRVDIKTLEKRHKKGIRKRFIIYAATAVILVISVVVSGFSMSLRYEDMSGGLINSLKPGARYDDGNYGVIMSKSSKTYADLESAIIGEKLSDFPTSKKYADLLDGEVLAVRYGHIAVTAYYRIDGYDLTYSGNCPDAVSKHILTDPVRIGGFDVAFCTVEENYQATFYVEDNSFYVLSWSKDVIEDFILSLAVNH